MQAQNTASQTRAHWEQAKKPFVISFEDDKNFNEPLSLGVYAQLNDATQEECTALGGVVFVKKGREYSCADRNASTTDTTALIYACFPYHKGLTAQDTLQMKAPFVDQLFATESNRSFTSVTNVRMKMQSSMAQLRIKMESDDVRDRLNSLQISGDEIYTEGVYKPYSGQWISKVMNGGINADSKEILLNNGRNHDFYLIPTDVKGVVNFFARINERNYAVKATLPPLVAGSLTQLILRKGKDGLTITSSWVESKRPLLEPQPKNAVDTVKVGYYLQKEGYISKQPDSNSIALIIETEGKHGKAIALNDAVGNYCFSKKPMTSKQLFTTVDGKRKEGVLNPRKEDGVEEENAIIYKPKMPYSERCALGYQQGEVLTHKLLTSSSSINDITTQAHTGINLPRKSMLEETLKHPGSYVPSLAEMTKFYYSLHPFKDRPLMALGLQEPRGEYLTSTEQSSSSFYMIDFDHGIIAGGLSKQYAKLQLRLFYLF